MPRNLTHMFWAYGLLSMLERICVNSFLAQGYDLQLWSYDRIPDLPAGTTLRDAREVIPESRVFKYANGSYAAFANLFRYAVLAEHGGLYADTDVICLMPAAQMPEREFLVLQRQRDDAMVEVNNNLIYNPHPAPGNIIDLAHAVTERYPVSKLQWGDCGPRLLTALAHWYRDHSFEIMPPDFANAIDYWNCPKQLLQPGRRIPEGARFLHCFNEMWRLKGVDKDAGFPTNSIMERMQRQFG